MSLKCGGMLSCRVGAEPLVLSNHTQASGFGNMYISVKLVFAIESQLCMPTLSCDTC